MLTLVRESDSTIHLCFNGRHQDISIDSTAVKGFSLLHWEGMVFGNGTVGHPDLPTLSTLVHLPIGSTLKMEDDVDSLTQVYWYKPVPWDKPLVPVTEGWFKDAPQPEYRPDEKIYSSWEGYRGGERIEIENLGIMGSEQVFRLTVHPVRYQPKGRHLDIDTYIEATLKVEKSAAIGTNLSPSRYLIVSRPQFCEGLQPFVQWKRQEGYDVVELYADTNERNSVKVLMRPLFDNATEWNPAPKYTLLVGDHEHLEAFPGTMALNGESHFTDLYYAEFTDDYLPETMLGRWPVNDTAELRVVVEKTLRYEQFLAMDTLQMKRVLLVAGKEYGNPAPTTTNGQVNYLKREIKQAHPDIDTLCWYNPASDNQGDAIATSIGQGACLLNYTGHGTYSGWSHPAITADTIAAAETTQPVIYVNNCCQSNAFTGTGFGERLLRMPTGGAVGVIGATNSTLWQEDYFWALGPKYPLSLDPAYDSTTPGAFDGMIRRHRTTETLGELLYDGNLAVTTFGTAYAKYYWEIYCLLGDPTLKPWIGVPQSIDMQVTDGLFNGEIFVHVSGTQGARVTAMQDGVLLGVADIDSTGHAVIELCQTLDTLPLVITSTGVDLWPRVDTFYVNDVESGVTLRNVVADDNTVHCTVENIGNTRYDSLRVELSQVLGQTSDGAVIEFQIVIIDSLLPHSQLEVTLPVNVVALGQQPLWDALLNIWDLDNGIMCWLPISHSLPVTYPTLTTRLLDNGGMDVLQLLPISDYQLEASVEGDFDSLILTVTSHPNADTLINLKSHLSPLTSHLSTPDTLCSLHVESILHYDGWTHRQDYWLESGNRMESFEHGFADRPWDNIGRVPWALDSTVSHNGSFSVRSGAIDHSQITELCLDVALPHNDSISFWVKTSTEPQRDRLTFFVDNIAQSPTWWGESGWQRVAFPLASGMHHLCWRYSKDASNSRGDDCVWIDDISMPLTLWQEAGEWECSAASVGIENSQLSSLNSHLLIYPNPSTGQVNLLSNEAMTVYITDVVGRHVSTLPLKGGENTTWSAPTGIYFATGSTGRAIVTKKIIIK